MRWTNTLRNHPLPLRGPWTVKTKRDCPCHPVPPVNLSSIIAILALVLSPRTSAPMVSFSSIYVLVDESYVCPWVCWIFFYFMCFVFLEMMNVAFLLRIIDSVTCGRFRISLLKLAFVGFICIFVEKNVFRRIWIFFN